MKEIFEILIAQGGGGSHSGIPVGPEGSGEYIGAVSELIAAVMQTAGLYAQSDILANYAPLMHSFGALVYAAAVLLGIYSVAIYGNYKQAAWLLIGPSIFFWLVSSTVEVEVTSVQFGSRVSTDVKASQKMFLEMVGTLEPGRPAANVSWLFARYDSLVTQVVQNIVTLLVDTEFNEDLNIAATERVYSRVLASRSGEPGFIKLVSVGVMGKCGQYHKASMEKAMFSDSTAPGIAKSEEMIIYENLKSIPHTVPRDSIDYLRTIGPEGTNRHIASCSQKGDGGARAAFDKAVSTAVGSDAGLTCDEIWQLVCIGAMEEADKALSLTETNKESEEAPGARDSGIDWDKVREKVEETIVEGGDPGKANQILAAHLLKNTMRFTAHSQMTTQIASRTPFSKKPYDFVFGTNSKSDEFTNLSQVDTPGARAAIVHFAAWVPYIQGLLLYILTISFPFFAVFLLIPDRWTAVYVWMSLWLWVKCWDVGFATIYFVRKFLWDYMQNGVAQPDKVDVDWNTQSSIYEIMQHNDPMASTHTYYNLIALLTLSVPAITAHFCAGAPNLYKAFKSSIDDPSTQIGQRREAQRRLYVTRSIEQGDPSAGHPEEMQYGIQKTMDYARGAGLDVKSEEELKSLMNKADGSLGRKLGQVYNNARLDFRFGGAENNRSNTIAMYNAMSTGRNDPYLHTSGSMAVNNRVLGASNIMGGRDFGDATGGSPQNPSSSESTSGVAASAKSDVTGE